MFSTSFVLLCLFSLVISKEVTGVFTKFNSLKWESAGNYQFQAPSYPNWIADLTWVIDGSKVNKGDTFTLHMPCVFKFTTSASEVNLHVSGKTYATCSFAPGDVVVDYSELKCVASDSVGPSTYAYGTVYFPFTFNSGGSGLTTDLKCAPIFHDGTNTISFYDGDDELSIDVKFVGGARTNPDVIIRENRIIPSLNREQHYILAGNCANGYQRATIGFSVSKSGVSIDCDSMHALITDKLNEWYSPESATEVHPTVACNSRELKVTFRSISRGFRPFADVFMKVDTGVSNQVKYINQYQCVGNSRTTDNSKTVTWGEYQNDSPGANGQEVIVTTQTWTGSTTHVTTLPYTTSSGTITIEVNVPIPTVTTTTTCDCPDGTSTITASIGQTATEIVFISMASTTGNDESSSTPNDDSSTTGDDQSSSTSNDDSSTTGDDQSSSTSNDDSSTTGDDQSSSTSNDDSSTTGDDEPSGTSDTEETTTTCIEDESASESEESTSMEPEMLSTTEHYTISTEELNSTFRTASDIEESTAHPIEESSTSKGHDEESSNTVCEESSTIEDSTRSTQYITTTIIDGSTTTLIVSEATTITVEDCESSGALTYPTSPIPLGTSTKTRGKESSGIASSGSASSLSSTVISTTKVSPTGADESATTRVTSRYSEPTQWTTGSTSVPIVPETFLGSASSFTLSAALVIFIEIFVAFML
ncbi:uncharacterized protein J8A68_006082 [[Candida] subhashii]|uniref:Agglutinin-like protein N-terminal domain-containing protein n=1 Tax=[Candida] subhashii TaxID=561895 RepID=A0A8J5UGP0_9ASCO|nr:uncharacterized protein J8A68_006082 [[Candida] subhashii]KAG7660407.1 hypothetical protein J8A68_006082 [[Candida] subhashii]